MFKKSLALVLCVLVLFSVTAPAFASSAGADDITKSYLEFRTMNVNPVINTVLAAASSIEISEPDPVSGIIAVQGSFANAAQGSGFTYVIFYPGKTPADADAAVAASEPLDGIIADAGQGDVLANGGFAFDFALPPTAPKGSYTIYVACAGEMLQASYEVYQIITSLTLNTPANLAQTYGSTEAVTFTATASPDGAVNPDTIEWYVNDVLQDETGTTFSYTPTAAVDYIVTAKVSNNPDAMVDSKIIRVAKADVAVAWPEIQINYKSNLKLCDITLPTGFSWAQSDTKINVSGGFYPAVYTPADTVNYSSISGEIKIRVKSEGSSGGGSIGGGGSTSSDDYVYVVNGDEITITKYKGAGGDISIPGEIEGKPVTSIGYDAFNNCTSLTGVIIPNSVTSIKTSAFNNCNRLVNITIPDGVISIGYYAFDSCTALKNVTLPYSITNIGNGAFQYCISLESINLPSGITSINHSTFASCTSLTNIDIPASVTAIQDEAFYNCISLTAINVDENNPVYSSCNGVLFNKEQTTLITYPSAISGSDYIIPTSVISIGYAAFFRCANLTSITIPASITSITQDAFMICSDLVSIIVDENNPVYSSSNGVLFNKNQTTLIKCPFGRSGTYIIPDSVTNIGYAAFGACRNLTSISISPSVTSISDYAFEGCYNLSALYFKGNAPSSFGTNVFDSCYKLIIYYLPTAQGFTSPTWNGYPSRILELISDLSLTVSVNTSDLYQETVPVPIIFTATPTPWENIDPDTMQWYVNDILQPTTGATYRYTPENAENNVVSVKVSNNTSATVDSITIAETADYIFDATTGTIIRYIGAGGNVVIPDSINGIGVSSIGKSAFSYFSRLTGITIPTGVISIESAAFYNCSNLTTLDMKTGVTSIGESAFYNCRSLTNITLPDSVINIGESAFYKCSSLTNVILQANITSIGNGTFADCDSLISITLPSSITSIGASAFHECYRLTNITIPTNVSNIGAGAFEYCRSLTSITIPTSVKSIGYRAFANSTSLTNLDLGTGVTSIGSFAFSACTSLAKLTIPGNVTSIGAYAFEKCTSLTNVTTQAGVTSIDEGAFRNCTNLRSVTIPTSVTSIAKGTFGNCSNLMSITLPSSITSIGAYAFQKCTSLTNITIPTNVSNIGDYAFEYCNSLSSITLPASITSINFCAFNRCTNLSSVYFEGYAPSYIGYSVFANAAPDFTIYYLPTAQGFTSPTWNGYPTATYNLITGLTLNTPTNLIQTYGATDSVAFTAATLPEGAINPSTIEWYVNDVKQDTTGTTFTYTPTEVGRYTVAVKVSNNPDAAIDSKTITVHKAGQKTPAIKTSKTSTAITVREVTGAEYGIKLKNSTESIVYSSNNKFTSLKSDTVYTVYVRMAAKENYEASPAASLDIRTETATSNSGNHKGGTITVAPAPEPTPQADPPPKRVPTDIAQVDWAQGYIQDAIDKGIMTGYIEADGSTSFRPAATATRAEFATALFNYMGFEKDGDLIFSDTKDHWAKDYIAKLAKEGIMTGISTAAFAPDQPITREQLAAILYRALKPKAATAAFRYSDSSSISDWAVEGVYAVREAGWITGDVSGTFRPSDTATRAEIATIFSRLASKK